MRFHPFLRIQNTSPGNDGKPKSQERKDDTGEKFLMGTTKNLPPEDEDSRATIEMLRAERIKFIPELMLATVQSENFRP